SAAHRTRARAGARSLHGVSHAADGREGGGKRAVSSVSQQVVSPASEMACGQNIGNQIPFRQLYLTRPTPPSRCGGAITVAAAARIPWERAYGLRASHSPDQDAGVDRDDPLRDFAIARGDSIGLEHDRSIATAFVAHRTIYAPHCKASAR